MHGRKHINFCCRKTHTTQSNMYVCIGLVYNTTLHLRSYGCTVLCSNILILFYSYQPGRKETFVRFSDNGPTTYWQRNTLKYDLNLPALL